MRFSARGNGAKIALGAVVVFLTWAGAATASTWTARQLSELGQKPFFAISCPSTSLCVAVGPSNTIATTTNPAGPAGGWSVVSLGGAGQPNQNQIKGVSCPSPALCVAVSFEGLILTSTDPTGGAGAWSVANLSPSGPKTHFYGVSCPSPAFCVAVAGGAADATPGPAKVFTSTSPTGGAAAWSQTQLPGPLELRGVSCPSPAFCVAVGDNGDRIRPQPEDLGEVLSSTDPLGGAWQQVQTPGVPGNLFGVSCPTAALCVTGNVLGKLLVSTQPTGPASSWPPIDSGATVQITAADCPSATRCIAVDNNADVITSTAPTGGAGTWNLTNLIPYTQIEGTFASNAMWGVSCPSISFCAIAAGDGQIFTSEEPFAAPPAPVKREKAPSRKHRGPKRPRTRIAGQLSTSGVHEFAGRAFVAHYRFYALEHATVRGFSCKIDRRRPRPCHSPAAFRVGFGKHHFRVRAIGWSGLKGPVAKAYFRVCRPIVPHPAPLPPCWRHLPPVTPPVGH